MASTSNALSAWKPCLTSLCAVLTHLARHFCPRNFRHNRCPLYRFSDSSTDLVQCPRDARCHVLRRSCAAQLSRHVRRSPRTSTESCRRRHGVLPEPPVMPYADAVRPGPGRGCHEPPAETVRRPSGAHLLATTAVTCG